MVTGSGCPEGVDFGDGGEAVRKQLLHENLGHVSFLLVTFYETFSPALVDIQHL